MSSELPKQIGLLIGREWSWPSALISEINKRNIAVTADFVKIGGTFLNTPCPYDVIIDRMSHEIPYYRTYLKYAALSDCYIMNDPFMVSADDKFFGLAFVNQLGIRTPRTASLPNKRVEAENVPESFRNLVYPMDWQGIIDYVGVPAILKDINTGGRRVAHRVHDVDELIRWYDESDTLTVVLQEVIESDQHIHCFVIGQESVLLARYALEDGNYLADSPIQLDAKITDSIRQAALAVTRTYGYDINMVEFVVRDGESYLINPTNPVPDMDINLFPPEHFNWCIQETANHAIRLAQESHTQFENYAWMKALR
jgi:glutathione synthase/RimK-type ligase-like ATP-grasp enzyme